MLFGIRQSVHSVMHESVYQLTDREFTSKYRYELEAIPVKNKQRTISYEFFDFAPRMFHLIRQFYGIDSAKYLQSIGPESLFGSLNMGKITSLKSLTSSGKSGSLFYYTADGAFMLKTISHDEFEHFKFIMKEYYLHLLKFPHTMIARFFGLHKIKFVKTTKIERIYFVIMANVFNTTRDIDVRYDLKGSTQGRITRKDPNVPFNSKEALKDLDWLRDDRIISLRPELRAVIIQQLEEDTKFFQKMNINDYSVLLGIHYFQPPESAKQQAKQIVANSPNFDILYMEGIKN